MGRSWGRLLSLTCAITSLASSERQISFQSRGSAFWGLKAAASAGSTGGERYICCAIRGEVPIFDYFRAGIGHALRGGGPKIDNQAKLSGAAGRVTCKEWGLLTQEKKNEFTELSQVGFFHLRSTNGSLSCTAAR